MNFPNRYELYTQTYRKKSPSIGVIAIILSLIFAGFVFSKNNIYFITFNQKLAYWWDGLKPKLNGLNPFAKSDVIYFADCNKARAAKYAPMKKNEAGYRIELDEDGDGIACETSAGKEKLIKLRKTS